jgi:hypothetical protein
MKPSCIAILFICILAACEKPNDIAALQDQATITAKFYQPKLEELNHRIQAIAVRGKALPTGLAGVSDASRLLSDAGRRLMASREVVAAGADGKSKLEKEAAELAKAGDLSALEKRVDEASEELEENTRVANDELLSVESWLTLAETQPAAPPKPAETPTPEATPAPQ